MGVGLSPIQTLMLSGGVERQPDQIRFAKLSDSCRCVSHLNATRSNETAFAGSFPDEVELKGLETADFYIEPENQRKCGHKKNRKCGLGTFDLFVFRVNNCTLNVTMQLHCQSDGNDCSHNQPRRAGGQTRTYPCTGKLCLELAGSRRVGGNPQVYTDKNWKPSANHGLRDSNGNLVRLIEGSACVRVWE